MKKLLKRGLNHDVSGFSEHFLRRVQERRLKLTDIKEALKNPHCSFQNGQALIYVGPKVTVVIGANGRLITAYKNRKSEYKGSKKKDIRNKRRKTDDRQNDGIPGIGVWPIGEES